MRPLATLAYITFLAGCSAANQKPELVSTGYGAFARDLVGAQRCAEAGHVSPEDAATGRRLTLSNLQTYVFDEGRMQVAMGAASRMDPPSR